MADLIARLLEPLLGLLFPPRGKRRRSDSPPPPPPPYVCPAVCYRPDVRPLRGEDNRLVRPYLMAEASA
ncbi:hypothetical protein GCM10017668_24620 [Streptomyces tuirus]|uniref:Uncharacterized protein n=1 Tax=Streptomyces tuirus TaxID=68278 RepID=A0A7G1NCR9_9ACTN|nr:hypothetical protein GCM10017668_24620 [Streptomyces tuirus]